MNTISFNYQLLGRLRSDCEYYLNGELKNEKHLWALSPKAQIEKMKELWTDLPIDMKPDWLTWEQILQYEKQMIGD